MTARPPSTERWHPSIARAALLAVPVAFLGAFFAWPVARIVVEGLRPDRTWDLSGVGEVLGDARLRGVAWFTLWQALASTAATLLIGLPACHVLARYRFPGRRLVRALVIVPFVMPTVVVGAAFLALIGPRSPLGLELHRTPWAIIAAHVFFNLAVVIRVVGGLWEALDPRTVEAARLLGASRPRAFREVTLPALRPAIGSAALIVFLFTFTSFGVVQLLGGPRHATLEVEIYRQTATLLDLPVASVLALLQLAAVVVVLFVQDRVERRRAPGPTALVPVAPEAPRGAARLWVAGNLAVLAAVLVVPVAALVARSFRVGGTTTLAAWRRLGEHSSASALFVPPAEAVLTSLRFAVVATVVAVVVGGLAAFALRLPGGRLARTVDAALLVPLGTSAVTVGFGFLLALDRPPLDLRSSALLVPIAQAVVALPFVVRATTPVLRAIDPRLREAAAVLGASPMRAWREIDLPMATRALVVAAGFAFAISLGEFGATTVIARADTPTVPVAIDRLLSQPGGLNVAQAFVLSTVLMALAALAVGVADRLRPSSGGGGWV